MLLKILFWVSLAYVFLVVGYFVLVCLIEAISSIGKCREPLLNFSEESFSPLTFRKRINEGKFFLLDYEHEGGGSCQLMLTEFDNFDQSYLEHFNLYFIFLLDENGKVADSYRGQGSFSSFETDEWLQMIKSVEYFWRERDLYV
jgi:hypothetical protein